MSGMMQPVDKQDVHALFVPSAVGGGDADKTWAWVWGVDSVLIVDQTHRLAAADTNTKVTTKDTKGTKEEGAKLKPL